MSWTIGVSTGSFYPFQTMEQALHSIAEEGFDVAELFVQTPGEYTAVYGRRILRAVLARGVRVHSIHLNSRDLDPFSPYAPRRADSDALFRHSLELAHAIGARVINWHGAKQAELEAGLDLELVWDRVEQWRDWAAESGVALTLENVSWCMLRSPDEIQMAREKVPSLTFTFDAFQAVESGEEPTAVARAMGSAISTVHLSDYGSDARHLIPGRGHIDWRAVLLVLTDLSYNGPLMIELGNLDEASYASALAESMAFLRDLMEQLGLRVRLA